MLLHRRRPLERASPGNLAKSCILRAWLILPKAVHPGFCLLGARASHCSCEAWWKTHHGSWAKNHHPLDIQGTYEYNWDQHSTERTYRQHCFWKYSSSCYRYLLINCSAPMPTSKYVFLKCFGLHHVAILCFSPNHSNIVLESTPAHASWYLRSRRSSLTWITSSSNKTHQGFFYNSMKSTLLKNGCLWWYNIEDIHHFDGTIITTRKI